MKKNMLVFDTTNFTAPDSDGRPAVRVEEVEVGVNVRVIVCTRCGKAVTPAFRWDENGGPFVLRAFVECPECVEAAPDKDARIAELEARLKVAEKKFKDEREHSEWLQEECNKAVDEKEEANGRAVTLEAALKAVEWNGMGQCQWCLSVHTRGHKPDCARQSALSPAEKADDEKEVKG